jgi:hypothetical protein
MLSHWQNSRALRGQRCTDRAEAQSREQVQFTRNTLHLTKSTSYEPTHSAFFPNFPSLHLTSAQIFSSAPFSKALILCFSLNGRDKVSLPYKTTGKIIILYIQTADKKTKGSGLNGSKHYPNSISS